MNQPEPIEDAAATSRLRELVSMGRMLVTVGSLGFALVAWWPLWPIDLPSYGFLDGLVLLLLGAVSFAIPGVAAWLAFRQGRRRNRSWFGLGVALALAALYVAYFWGSLMLYFREPENTFFW